MAPRNRHPERTLARKAKKANIGREQFISIRESTIVKQAKREGWPRSSLAMTLADVSEAAEYVYDGRRRP